jgi:Methyltransferase domain
MSGLIDPDFVRSMLTRDAPWSGGHGAEEGYLGMGLFYYALTYVRRAKLAVCLGSGGGFVPRLMRQAQRDLGISDSARTILVDANRAQAGWGSPTWLDTSSYFRRNFPDVEIVISTTADAAANLFARQRLTIDVLHIDADHSFAACLDDFRRYRPFLTEGSLVTFHDTAFPGAGVAPVMEYLRSRGDCEIVDMSDVGSGMALVRVLSAAPPPAPLAASGGDPPVAIARKPDAPAPEPPSRSWAYLASEAFSARAVLAARFLRDCPMIIELGGGRPTIDNFLTGAANSRVVVIDPFLRERPPAAATDGGPIVQHIRCRFQDITWRIDRPGEHGLVMLGLELQGMSDADWRMLCALVDGARTTVIEFPTSWRESADQYAAIRRQTRTRERFTCRLDLSGNDVGDMTKSWPPRFDREIHVLEPL